MSLRQIAVLTFAVFFLLILASCNGPAPLLDPSIKLNVTSPSNWAATLQAGNMISLEAVITPAANDSVIGASWTQNTATPGTFVGQSNNTQVITWRAPSQVTQDTPVELTLHAKTLQRGSADATVRFTVTPRGELDPLVKIKINDSESWGSFQQGQTLTIAAEPTLAPGDSVKKVTWLAMNGTFLNTSPNTLVNSLQIPLGVTATTFSVSIETMRGGIANSSAQLNITVNGALDPVVAMTVNGNNTWSNFETGTAILLKANVTTVSENPVVSTEWLQESSDPTVSGTFLTTSQNTNINAWQSPSVVTNPVAFRLKFIAHSKLGGTTTSSVVLNVIPKGKLPQYYFNLAGMTAFNAGLTATLPQVKQGTSLTILGNVWVDGANILPSMTGGLYDKDLNGNPIPNPSTAFDNVTFKWAQIPDLPGFNSTNSPYPIWSAPALQADANGHITATTYYLQVTTITKDGYTSTNTLPVLVVP